MTSTAIQIMTDDGQNLPLTRDLRDALATYARREWPTHTAKRAAKAWGASHSTAINILKGHAPAATLTHVLRKGGWGLARAVVGAVIGQEFQERRPMTLADRSRSLPAILGPRRSELGPRVGRGLGDSRRRASGRGDRPAD